MVELTGEMVVDQLSNVLSASLFQKFECTLSGAHTPLDPDFFRAAKMLPAGGALFGMWSGVWHEGLSTLIWTYMI